MNRRSWTGGMIEFCGQDTCTVDANGRVKLAPRFLLDFRRHGPEVVLHCLPEGAMAVYPAMVWTQMRQNPELTPGHAAQSAMVRRQFRWFGALTSIEAISNQGRITIPAHFRSLLDLLPGTEAVLVGCELGVEIWNSAVWQQEFLKLREHQQQKADVEMTADLQR